MLFGYEPLQPIDLAFKLPKEFKTLEKFRESFAEMKELVRIRVRDAQETQKAFYDSRHFSTSFNVGDLVAVYDHQRIVGTSEKLLPKFSGPYRITRRLNPVTYEIQSIESPKKKKKRINLSRLKKWNSETIEELDEVDPIQTVPSLETDHKDYSDQKMSTHATLGSEVDSDSSNDSIEPHVQASDDGKDNLPY